MSVESGGRADKYGNEYEKRYLAKILLSLINEKIVSVTVEPVGVEGVEFFAEEKDGKKCYYQCKLSNMTNDSWTVSDLKRRNIFNNIKQILLQDEKAMYYFVSPLAYNELDELCKRAGTNSSVGEFRLQLGNKKIKKAFDDCIVAFGLDKDSDVNIERMRYLLSRCNFVRYLFDSETQKDFDELISMTLTGNVAHARVILENYVDANGKYGTKITKQDLVSYLENSGIKIRNYGNDNRIYSRLNALNCIYWGNFQAISDKLIHRSITDKIIGEVEVGNSIILHGKAGSGKTGCLQELINYLRKESILYLALKLDKNILRGSADSFGKNLNLPESPVHCLATLAAGKKCVLILDQLDALRWNSNFSADALNICKEMFFQAESINKHEKGRIIIVVASRTFDLETDRAVENLFISEDKTGLKWSKIKVDLLDPKDVKGIIGDEYDKLTPRLRKLILTPSSLYIWSKLDVSERNNSIKSVFELMNKWWIQINKKCIDSGIENNELVRCKDKIVNLMENSGLFFIQQSLVADFPNAVEALVSNGLITYYDISKKISFTHQSFLDYFIISKYMEEIYQQKVLPDLIGDWNKQIPTSRYRLVSVLQNLMDSDTELFIRQACAILESGKVRFYFKCTVFEVIGQCEFENKEIFKIVDTYLAKKEWTKFVERSVLLGHDIFVKHFLSNKIAISDNTLTLLRSICEKAPDYVAEVLSPYALQSKEMDKKIYYTLCHTVTNDSEKMFALRKKILANNPEFFEDCYCITDAILNSSIRAIDLIEILLDNFPEEKKENIYLPINNNLYDYVKKYYKTIIEHLYRKVFDLTREFNPVWPENKFLYSLDCKIWINQKYTISFPRKVVLIVKLAFIEYAQSEPVKFIKFINSINTPVSGIIHEIISEAICSLDVECSDWAIEWLLKDFDKKIFVFSADEEDYLCITKKIIEKFSQHCNKKNYIALENRICEWHEPAKRMAEIYKMRLEQKHNHDAYFYTYWGHLQKSILPYMAQARLSEYSKKMLEYLNRNQYIQLPYFYSGFIMGELREIVSPVRDKADKLSDKTWLQIIAVPQGQIKGHWTTKKDSLEYEQVSEWQFASAIGTQARKHPERFANLLLKFPDSCYSGYISNILFELGSGESEKTVEENLLFRIIKRFGRSENSEIALGVIRIIEKYSEIEWPIEVLDILKEMALNYPNSESEKSCKTEAEKEYEPVEKILNRSFNCVRACAIRTIALLIFNNKDYGGFFKDTIISAISDRNNSVWMAAMSCVFAYYNIDSEFSFDIFKELVNKDLRVLMTHNCWDFISRQYKEHTKFIQEKLIEACSSVYKDLAEYIAGLLCALAIYFNDNKALEFIISKPLSIEQKRRICNQAISSFDKSNYKENSKRILSSMIDNTSEKLIELGRLFSERRLSINSDTEFILYLMKSEHGKYLFDNLIEYMNSTEDDICDYAPLLFEISKTVLPEIADAGIYFHLEYFTKCVLRIYDRGDFDTKSICLDIWDSLFMNNLYSANTIPDMID